MHIRGVVFAVIFAMEFVFVALGALGLLPFAALVTAVSLGGTAIAVMMAFNIVGDVAVCRRMYSAPGAYLHALTPAPRWKILLSSVITMAVMDIVTMAVVITGEVWMSLLLAGEGIVSIVRNAIVGANAPQVLSGIWSAALLLAGYLLTMMIVLFCVTVRKSVFYQKPAGGLLTALLAVGTAYAVSLSVLLLAPFGNVTRFGAIFTITLGSAGTVLYALLALVEAAALFILTARLMERKMNL